MRRHYPIYLGGMVIFLAVLAIGGYTRDWKWTGFHGDTLWDWLQLLLVPFVLPAALAHVAAGASTADREAHEHVPERSIG